MARHFSILAVVTLALGAAPAFAQGTCDLHDLDTGGRTADLNRSKLRMAVDGDLLVVASPWLAGSDLTIRRRDPSTGGWLIDGTIPVPAGTSGPGFGEALDLDGARLAVAHPADAAVWLYDLQVPGAPALEQRVPVDLPPASFLFDQAFRCRLAGNLLLVAAAPTPAIASGHVAVFERDPSTATWLRTGEVTSPSLVWPGSTEWGRAFDLDGATLVVGDPLGHGGRGSAHVFRRDASGAWLPVLEVTGAGPGVGLGNRVALQADAAVVGNRSHLDRQVEVLRRSPVTGVWSHQQTLDPPFPEPNINGDNFGQELALARGTLLASTPHFHVTPSMGGWPEGLVSVFVLDPVTGEFVLEESYVSTVGGIPVIGEFWGYALGFDGEQVAISRLAPRFQDWELHVDVFVPRTSDCDGDSVVDACEFLQGLERDDNLNGVIDSCEETGTRYCSPAPVNSTGEASRITVFGAPRVAQFYLDLRVAGLAHGSAGYVIASRGTVVVPGAGGSLGALCIAGAPIARAIGGVRMAGADGSFRVDYNRGLVPLPGGVQAILAGDTWNFQAWFRDAGPVPAFTDAVGVTFTAF